MLKTYLNIAVRSITKNKFFSILNIVGLAVGMGCVLLIFLYIQDELSYDKHIPEYQRTYRMHVKGKFGGSDLHIINTSSAVAPAIIKDYPEIESFLRFRSKGAQIIKYGENSIKEDKAVFADSNYFDFWGAKMIQGNPRTALKEPQSMVLSPSLAKKLFGDENPLDKYVKVAGKFEYKITGVMEPMPENTHFGFEVLMSISSLDEVKEDYWLNMNFISYYKLRAGSNVNDLEAKFPDMIQKYIGPEIQHFLGASLEEFLKSGNAIGFYMEPLEDIYLRSTAAGDLDKKGDIKYIYIFAIIGIFILVIACINFMNLATARSSSRAKEVGIRKVIGAQKNQLVTQFMVESIFVALIALLIAIVLVFFSFSLFNNIAEKSLDPMVLLDPRLIAMMLAVVIFVGLVAGSYPAFFLSSFRPVVVLKGKLARGAKSGTLRSTLVVFQFMISIFLIIGTMTVYKQLQFIQNKNLGFEKDQILILENSYMLRNSIKAFRDEVVNNADFSNGTISSFTPTPSSSDWVTAFWEGKTPTNEGTTTVNVFQVDEHYVPTYDLKIKEGRNFSKDYATDTAAILVNEALVRHFGLEEPIGAILSTSGGHNDDGSNKINSYKIVGVLENFHFQDLKSRILPLAMLNGENDGRISFRLNTTNYSEAVEQLKSKWEEFAPGQPFEYKFADQELQSQYAQEQKISQIFGIFTGFAILVACLGLFGLASYTTEQRTKEIGIRKVMGASVRKIVFLLSKEFSKLVLIAFALAAPIGYFAMGRWLEDFEYRIELGVGIFLISGISAFLIAWLTMSYQSIRSATENPVKSLRTE